MPRDKSKYSFLLAWWSQYHDARSKYYSDDPEERASLPDDVYGVVHSIHDVISELAEEVCCDLYGADGPDGDVGDEPDDDVSGDDDASPPSGRLAASLPAQQSSLPGVDGPLAAGPVQPARSPDVPRGTGGLTPATCDRTQKRRMR